MDGSFSMESATWEEPFKFLLANGNQDITEAGRPRARIMKERRSARYDGTQQAVAPKILFALQ